MKTKFNDSSLSAKERIDWLLENMNISEKIEYLSGYNQNQEKYGLTSMRFGGEAAHGAENRNDQNGIGKPDYTTSFPQPFGMSSSFDRELIKKAGEVTGIEVRATYKRHPGGGLSRWAPTVDLERDPRWGRNEESYGEDPFLTGEMASSYIKGIQGENKKYLRVASTLKHFYANNVEDGRTYKNSSIDARNKFELYLEPFRRCIENGGAEGVMTAYNKINGTPGIINSDVRNILKEQYGVTHAVSDGGATQMVVIDHGYFKSHAESVAAALKAGVDSFSDRPDFVYKSMKDAYEYGMIDEKLIDNAIRNCLKTRIRLGIFDDINNNPYDKVGEEDICSAYGKEVCKKLTDESLVLLRNEKSSLPLSVDKNGDCLAVIGPMADSWFTDWYGGTPEYRSTLKDGLEHLLNKKVVSYDGYDRVNLKINNSYVQINEKDEWVLSDHPSQFILGDWGEGSFTLKSVDTGKYALTDIYNDENRNLGIIKVNKDEPFDWFVTEIFHLDGNKLLNRFDSKFTVLSDGRIVAKNIYGAPGALIKSNDGEIAEIEIEIVESGVEKAAKLASEYSTVIMAMGCCSTINAKEQIDRSTIELPDRQKSLISAILSNNSEAVMALFTNYPYAFNDVNNLPNGIIMSATGSQDMGQSMADAIFGKVAPAGRLNMTWYLSDDDLPDINDYDIIKGKRTYRFFDGKVLYPFGYGLTYSQFSYSDMSLALTDYTRIKVEFNVTNEGDVVSDEVVQVYFIPPKTRTVRSRCQLCGFERLHDVNPGETRKVSIYIPYEELKFFDVVSNSLIVEEGDYKFFVGKSSEEEVLSAYSFVHGVKVGKRQASTKILCDRYDDYENIELVEGICGFGAATQLDNSKAAKLIYKDFEVNSEWKAVKLFVSAYKDFMADVYVNGVKAGSYGDDNGISLNASKEHINAPGNEIIEADVVIPVSNVSKGIADIEIRFSGNNARVCYIEVLEK